MDAADPLRLPVRLARDTVLLGGSVLALRLYLLAVHLRPEDTSRADFAVGDLPILTGARVALVPAALESLRAMQGSVLVDGTWLDYPLVGDVAFEGGRGGGATIDLAPSLRHLGPDRDLTLPLGEVTGARTRCGLLLRLRGAYALSDWRRGPYPTWRVNTGDLSYYTGYEPMAGKRAATPSLVVRDHVDPGVADVAEHSELLHVEARSVMRRGPRSRDWLDHLHLTFKPLLTKTGRPRRAAAVTRPGVTAGD